MAEGGEGVEANPESVSFSLISAAFEEYERALNEPKPVANTRDLDAFLREYPNKRLEKVRDLIHRMSIPQVLFHHEWIETQTRQTAEDQEDRVVSIYEFVKENLIYWTGCLGSREHGQPKCKKTDSTYKLIVWSAELWFFQQIEKMNGNVIQQWISDEGAEKLFKKYFAPLDEDAPRFTIITQENACMLLRQLLRVSKVKRQLKQFLSNWKNVRKITVDSSVEMTGEMARIYDSSSNDYYIFPSEPSKKKYGMHFYLTNFFEDDGGGRDTRAIRDSIKEARNIRKALKKCTFHLRAPTIDQFDPNSGTFDQLEDWLSPTLKRIQQRCSMLFMSFSVHGDQGRMMDTNGQYKEIETILSWLNDSEDLQELKKTPKVVVIQACQHVPEESNPDYDNEISERLGRFVKEETKNMRLLMAADKGEKYNPKFKKSYLFNIAKAMEAIQELDQPTISEIHKQGHGEDVGKSDKTQMLSAKVKDVVLCSRSTTQPTENESEEESDPDDDGHNLVTESEEEPGDDDAVVG